MAGSQTILFLLQNTSPHAYNAMTYLVMAMDKVHRNTGKKTFFGGDKGVSAYQEFQIKLKNLLTSMLIDGLIKESMPSEFVVENIVNLVENFSEAHPNWPDAYKFAMAFFILEKDEAVSVVERLR